MPNKNNKFGTLTAYVLGFAALISGLVVVVRNVKELENAWHGLVNPQGTSSATISPLAQTSPYLRPKRPAIRSTPVSHHLVGAVRTVCSDSSNNILYKNETSAEINASLWIENTGNVPVKIDWSGPAAGAGRPDPYPIYPGAVPSCVDITQLLRLTGVIHCRCLPTQNSNQRCEFWYMIRPPGCNGQ